MKQIIYLSIIITSLLLFISCGENERRDAIDIRQVETMVCRGTHGIIRQWPLSTGDLFWDLCADHGDALEAIMIDYASGESMEVLMPRYLKLRKRYEMFEHDFMEPSGEIVQRKLERMRDELF